MSIRRARAIRRIDAILTADLRPEAAYPLRARLGRAALAAADWLADGTDRHDRAEVQNLIDSLTATSRRIMQPSEPFDSVWQEQWHEVLVLLSRLRDHIAPARS